ncbi:hypothetical protein NLI96_g8123 [Meripilus lineatus]|uniref:Cytochrome P450 n=1 Tax=Meripilus lineatus TaxID=2056292 RepID=A0AAD5YGK4_9APHY|nr:hypothetical protein NLI96_g8123 [Physisporinus lineatus]
MSLLDVTIENFQSDHTLSYDVFRNPYHIPLIRSHLTKSLGVLFEDVRDEVCTSFSEVIPLTENWTKIIALPALMNIVCQTSNRVYVGLPTCRNSDYRDLNVQFTIDLVKAAAMLNLMPRFCRPLAARFLTNVPASIARGVAHLRPVIEERYQRMGESGKQWNEKPSDFLMWLMEAATGPERDVTALVVRIITMNFATIHATAMSFAHALYRLAANPQYIKPLREEVEMVIEEQGWTKSALPRMRRLDSFLRECQRYDSISQISMTRKAKTNFQFSDGTSIPAGTFVSAAAMAVHHDGQLYPDPDEFNPWSPGRFFAGMQLKVMFAHLVTTYDIKMEREGVIPDSLDFEFQHIPSPTAEVLFRRRRT